MKPNLNCNPYDRSKGQLNPVSLQSPPTHRFLSAARTGPQSHRKEPSLQRLWRGDDSRHVCGGEHFRLCVHALRAQQQHLLQKHDLDLKQMNVPFSSTQQKNVLKEYFSSSQRTKKHHSFDHLNLILVWL